MATILKNNYPPLTTEKYFTNTTTQTKFIIRRKMGEGTSFTHVRYQTKQITNLLKMLIFELHLKPLTLSGTI
jgi:hypothetical protein